MCQWWEAAWLQDTRLVPRKPLALLLPPQAEGSGREADSGSRERQLPPWAPIVQASLCLGSLETAVFLSLKALSSGLLLLLIC